VTTTDCPPLDVRITKSLLGYGVIAGPIYIVTAAAQAATRDGFDPTRHTVSQLTNGGLGWIQIANFVFTGAMTVAAAVGMRRALRPGRSGTWAAGLLGGYGIALILAGVFRADPADGFPPGTPPGVGAMSWHGAMHFGFAAIGFVCLVASCAVLGRWFARQGQAGWAWFSRLTALFFVISFIGMASGQGGTTAILAFTAAVVAVWVWLSAVSVKLYRRVKPPARDS
jgi:hypothetical membrane protein